MNISLNNNINYSNVTLKDAQKLRDRNNISSHTQQTFNGIEEHAQNFVKKQFVQKVLKSDKFNKFLKIAVENPGFYEAAIAAIITCTARPLTIMSMPGAKAEDKRYAASQSMASGLTGLAFAYAIFTPIEKALHKVFLNANENNTKTTFKDLYENFYTSCENSKTVQELVNHRIIPSKKEFLDALENNSLAKQDVLGYMNKYFKEHGKEYVDNLLANGNATDKEQWKKAAQTYSKALQKTFNQYKNSNVPTNKQYMIPESLEFLEQGIYKLKNSVAADKTKFLLNFGSKWVLFPLIASVTIYSIPKIMKVIFPNHKKSKGKSNINAMSSKNTTFEKQSILKSSAHVFDDNVFKKFNERPAFNSKQVSFSGGELKILGKALNKTYENCYQKPLSSVLSKIYDKLAYSNWFSRYVNNGIKPNEIQKFGMKYIERNNTGKILNKFDVNTFTNNLPEIVAVSGTGFYIYNTIRNKEIEAERKPALCTNMAVVALLSLCSSKFIEKLATPFIDIVKKKHYSLIKDKINYNFDESWQMAKKLVTTTFAFRYLGPVVATPIADKLVKLFPQKQACKKEN